MAKEEWERWLHYLGVPAGLSHEAGNRAAAGRLVYGFFGDDWRTHLGAAQAVLSAAAQGLADFELESATEVERHGFAFLLVQAAPRRVDCLPARQHLAGVIADSAYERLPGNPAGPTDQAERTVDLILERAQWDRVSNPRPQSGEEGGVLERRLRCTAL